MTNKMNKPRLGACVFSFDVSCDTLFVSKGDVAYSMHIEEERETDFWNIKKYLTGHYTVDEIASRTNVEIPVVIKTIDTLNQAGLLSDSISANEIVERIPFEKNLISVMSMWRVHMLQHELFRALESHNAPKEVLIGLLLETYHSVASAPEIISTAISSCRNKQHLTILKKLYDEESKHDKIIQQTLHRVGISNAQLDDACPLSSTKALTFHKKELARTDSLLFLIGFSFSEAKNEENTDILSALKRLSVNYGYDDSVLDPIYEHMNIDLQANHSDILSEAFSGIRYIEETKANEIINQVHLLKHCFDDYHAGILRYYSDLKNSLPPRTMSYADISVY